MATDSNVPITAGSGTPIDSILLTGGDYQQVIREARGTAKGTLSNIPWTVTTTGLASVIPADINRVGLLLVSAATGVVWFRFDSTVPTAATYDWYLNPGERWEITLQFSQLAISMAGQTAGGTIHGTAATCA